MFSASIRSTSKWASRSRLSGCATIARAPSRAIRQRSSAHSTQQWCAVQAADISLRILVALTTKVLCAPDGLSHYADQSQRDADERRTALAADRAPGGTRFALRTRLVATMVGRRAEAQAARDAAHHPRVRVARQTISSRFDDRALFSVQISGATAAATRALARQIVCRRRLSNAVVQRGFDLACVCWRQQHSTRACGRSKAVAPACSNGQR